MSQVSVRDLDVSFGSLKVLQKLNITAEDGEFLVLLGPSGCGKSTLLNAVAGLLDINGGQIFIGGKNVTWEEPKDRGIGMVFQSYALYPRMTAEGNLTFGLKMARVPKDEIVKRVAKAAAILQIEPLLKRRPAELSGGQRQRVAIGRALVRDVGVFLFDEPLSNLDAKLRTELRVEIKKLHQQLGSTMIYVTHDQIEALTLADRIAVMNNGVIQQLASPKEIYRRPISRFVAGFVGSPAMNFIAGKLSKANGQVGLNLDGGAQVSLAGYAFAAAPEDGQPVALGVRPEQLSLRRQQRRGEAAGDRLADRSDGRRQPSLGQRRKRTSSPPASEWTTAIASAKASARRSIRPSPRSSTPPAAHVSRGHRPPHLKHKESHVMANYRISFQLYGARKFPPLEPQLEALAAIGYDAVEPFGGNYADDPKGLRAKTDALGLTIPTAHMPLAHLEQDRARFIDVAKILGLETSIIPHVGGDERPSTVDGWKALGRRLSEHAGHLAEAGLKLGWHNHDFEYVKLPDGSRPIDHLLAGQGVRFEPDIAWIQRGGGNPATEIRKEAAKIVAFHMKDTAKPGTTKEDGWADVGAGIIDWKSVWPAIAATGANLLVVEHDNPSDWRSSAAVSYKYINGMAGRG